MNFTNYTVRAFKDNKPVALGSSKDLSIVYELALLFRVHGFEISITWLDFLQTEAPGEQGSLTFEQLAELVRKQKEGQAT